MVQDRVGGFQACHVTICEVDVATVQKGVVLHISICCYAFQASQMPFGLWETLC